MEQLRAIPQAGQPASLVASGLPAGRQVDRLLGEKGIPKDSAAGRREFGVQMERRRAEEQASDLSSRLGPVDGDAGGRIWGGIPSEIAIS